MRFNSKALVWAMRTIHGDDAVTWSATLSPDVRWLAAGQAASTVRLWDLTAASPQQIALTGTFPFFAIGHSLWALILGCLGGLLGQICYARTARKRMLQCPSLQSQGQTNSRTPCPAFASTSAACSWERRFCPRRCGSCGVSFSFSEGSQPDSFSSGSSSWAADWRLPYCRRDAWINGLVRVIRVIRGSIRSPSSSPPAQRSQSAPGPCGHTTVVLDCSAV